MTNTQCPVSSQFYTFTIRKYIKEAEHLSLYLIQYMPIRRHLIVQEQTETKHTIRAVAGITTLNVGICRANRRE